MEQLIFFAIIIIFSIIDSIARKKKRQQTGAPGGTSQLPDEWEDDVATYDADLSYDDAYEVETASREPVPLSEYTPRSYGPKESGGATRKSSEGMIPTDIWEEIAGLTRGRKPEPEPSPPVTYEPPPPVERIPPRPVSSHRVHRAHAGYGTDPSTRRRSEQDDLDPLRVPLSRDARAVRRQLRSQSRSALRRAIILQEVLGPPAATRPERFPE